MVKINKTIIIMAGGTGGHIYPGLAVANELKQHGYKVIWLGTKDKLEAKIVPKFGFEIFYLDIAAIRKKGLFNLLLAPIKISKSIYQAYKIIKQQKPCLVIGMGGFAAGPGGIASKLLKIPLVIHEQNSVPGLTNKLLSIVANKILLGLPSNLEKRKSILIGNPIRQELLSAISKKADKPKNQMNILIFGGSLGARVLNQIIPKTIDTIDKKSKINIWHQSGVNDFTSTKQAYQQLNIKAKVEEFITDMAKAYNWADLVISRAGALTVSELAAVGKASILIPYPHAVDNHQFYNAKFLTGHNAAICIEQKDFTVEKLSKELSLLLHNKMLIQEMGHHAYKMAKTKAHMDFVAESLTLVDR